MVMRFVRVVLLASAVVAAIAGGWALVGRQADLAVQQQSDQFWAALAVNGSPRWHFTSLDEMADHADIVVVGRIERLTAGREVRDLGAEAAGKTREEASVYFADATLTVQKTIKGAVGRSVKLQLLLPRPDLLGRLSAELPRERAIFFLTDMGAYFAKENPTSSLGSELKGTFDFVSPQGLLRDFGDNVGVTADEGDAFLQAASRKAFAEVLAETKRAANN